MCYEVVGGIDLNLVFDLNNVSVNSNRQEGVKSDRRIVRLCVRDFIVVGRV